VRARGILAALAAGVLAAGGCHPGECTDADGDGYCVDPAPICSGAGGDYPVSCYAPPADCNDDDPTIHPYATEIPYDGIDQNCDGQDAVELCDGNTDGDGNGLRGCFDPACADTCAHGLQTLCASAPEVPVGSDPVTVPGGVYGNLAVTQPSCFTASGTEQAYRLVPGQAGETGTLQITMVGGGTRGFFTRSACADPATETGCTNLAQASSEALVVAGGQPVFVITDGNSDTFTLTASFQVALCGDGQLVAPEACDDGNLVDGDGCSAACAFEAPFYCATATALAPGYLQVPAADHAPAGFAGSCAGAGAAERVFVFTPTAAGMLDVAAESEGLLALYARAACGDPGSELACAAPASVTTLHLAVTAGAPVYLFVDGGVPGGEMPPFLLTTVFFPAAP
jgi:cysteine-rich repeat protein